MCHPDCWKYHISFANKIRDFAQKHVGGKITYSHRIKYSVAGNKGEILRDTWGPLAQQQILMDDTSADTLLVGASFS